LWPGERRVGGVEWSEQLAEHTLSLLLVFALRLRIYFLFLFFQTGKEEEGEIK
jgi:hypothetical protein